MVCASGGAEAQAMGVEPAWRRQKARSDNCNMSRIRKEGAPRRAPTQRVVVMIAAVQFQQTVHPTVCFPWFALWVVGGIALLYLFVTFVTQLETITWLYFSQC